MEKGKLYKVKSPIGIYPYHRFLKFSDLHSIHDYDYEHNGDSVINQNDDINIFMYLDQIEDNLGTKYLKILYKKDCYVMSSVYHSIDRFELFDGND